MELQLRRVYKSAIQLWEVRRGGNVRGIAFVQPAILFIPDLELGFE